MTNTATPSHVRRMIGLVLISGGLLWVVVSGLCSAAVFISMATEGPGGFGELLSIVPMIVLFGGASAGFGFAVCFVGRLLRPK